MQGNRLIEMPVVTEEFDLRNNEDILVLHNYVNFKGRVILNREKAALLLVELNNFIRNSSPPSDKG